MIKVLEGDFLKVKGLPAPELIVTSPPYNLQVDYGKGVEGDNLAWDDYLEFSRRWPLKCWRLALADSRLCLNIPLDSLKGGRQSVFPDMVMVAKEVGWRYHTTIVWNEQNISRRTAWGSWMSASAPYVIAPVEMVAVFYKEVWKRRLRGQSDISREEFMEWTNGVWTFPGEGKASGHPAAFPVELPRRCIKLFSYVGDVVLDPFLGSGSTLVACQETGRDGIGVEINSDYCELARQRLEE